MENNLVQISHYEIYLQDLSHPYIDLTLLGIVRTLSEAQNSVKLFKEALTTSAARNLDKNYAHCTVIFRPVLAKENSK